MKHAKPKPNHTKQYIAVATIATTGSIPIIAATDASAAPIASWDRIAQCESGQRWDLPYGDASSTGGLQIQKPTWDEYKTGISSAEYPYQTSKATQIMVAEKILASQGPSAWTCNAMTGYPLSSSGPNSSHLNGGINPYGGGVADMAATPKPAAPRHEKAPAAGNAARAGSIHVVKPGEWLSKIALSVYGHAGRWHSIYAVNKRVIGSDPNLILPGQRLRLPGKAVTPPVQTPDTTDTKSHSAWINPCAYPITQSFMNPGAGYTLGYHTGIDIGAPFGATVLSPGPGTVVDSDTSAPYGNNVQIKFADGRYGLFAHLSVKSVTPGTVVHPGDKIGEVGSTGTNSSGPHLHFEIRITPVFAAGNFLDPVKWLAGHGVSVP